MTKPTIVFVPGAYHTAAMYSPTLDRLEEASYNIIKIQLPSVTNGPPPKDFWPDVDAIKAGILAAINEGQEVLLVAHSYGGSPSTQAAEGLLKRDREAKGLRNGIVRIYYLAAAVLEEGQSALDAFNLKPTDIAEENVYQMAVPKEVAISTYYNDLPRKDAEDLADQLQMHALLTFQSVLTYAAWKHVPCTYLLPTKDKAMSEEAINAFASKPGEWTVERIDGGHMVTNSKPEEVARSVRRAAGEDV